MIYEIFKVLGLLLQVILLVYLTFGTAYIFIFSVANIKSHLQPVIIILRC